MPNDRITYRSGYKYQLDDGYSVQLKHIRPEHDIKTEYIKLSKEGILYILRGYAWDGPSGPTVDTKNFMRGSLIHDALYQLIREGHLDRNQRENADKELVNACEEDGMNWLRRKYVYFSLRGFGTSAAMPSGERPLMVAP